MKTGAAQQLTYSVTQINGLVDWSLFAWLEMFKMVSHLDLWFVASQNSSGLVVHR